MKCIKILLLLNILAIFSGCTNQSKVGPNGEKIEIRRFCGIPYYETTSSTSLSTK